MVWKEDLQYFEIVHSEFRTYIQGLVLAVNDSIQPHNQSQSNSHIVKIWNFKLP